MWLWGGIRFKFSAYQLRWSMNVQTDWGPCCVIRHWQQSTPTETCLSLLFQDKDIYERWYADTEFLLIAPDRDMNFAHDSGIDVDKYLFNIEYYIIWNLVFPYSLLTIKCSCFLFPEAKIRRNFSTCWDSMNLHFNCS